jgi:hypothetical protein
VQPDTSIAQPLIIVELSAIPLEDVVMLPLNAQSIMQRTGVKVAQRILFCRRENRTARRSSSS